jgi:trans-aconitate methyltransferase
MAKTSTRPMVRIHNIETDEVIDREMNDAEFAEWEAEQAAQVIANAAAAQKAADRAALLSQLGITEEQAKLLLG